MTSILGWLDRISMRGLLLDAVAGINRLETRMTAIQEALADLTEAVQGVATRSQAKIDNLIATLAAERGAAADLAAAEDAEDVAQNSAIAEAQAATDAALAEVRDVPAQLEALSDQLDAVAADEAPEVPVEPEPETPAEPEAPVEEPTQEPAEEPTNQG